MREIRRLAEGTPPSRKRFVDLLRAVSIVAVVLGHWLVTVVGYDEHGELVGRSALPDLPWAHPLTWVAQVMPVFFFVGGYANAVSLAAERRRGGNAAEWLVRRSGRLVPPTTALVLVMGGGAVVSGLLGVAPDRARMVVWLASIPLWFLVAYLIMVALTPLMYALHRRYGLVVPLVLVGLVAAGDVARLVGHDFWGDGNFLFGWLAVHQMGFAWRDGLLPARPRVAVPLLLGGVGSLLLLTLAGPYPVSLINVPGERLHNMSPPSLALLSVATAQIGAALLLQGRAERWLRRTGRWTVVVAVNSVIMTIFLWHISAAILLAAALHVGGVLSTAPGGSAEWLAWRVPLLVMLGVVLTLLVVVFGPIEMRGGRKPRRGRLAPPTGLAGVVSCPVVRLWLALAGFAGVAGALLVNSTWPSTAPTVSGVPPVALITYLVCAAALRLLRSTSPSNPSRRAGFRPVSPSELSRR